MLSDLAAMAMEFDMLQASAGLQRKGDKGGRMGQAPKLFEDFESIFSEEVKLQGSWWFGVYIYKNFISQFLLTTLGT